MRKMPPAAITIMFLIMEMAICCCARNSTLGCIERERNALLRFKASLVDASDRLSSWNLKDQDCCNWQGVECNRITRHVIRLDLSYKKLDDYVKDKSRYYSRKEKDTVYGNQLRGKTLDSSLFELKDLTYLDLSWNDFQSSEIPSFLGSMKHLQHLNLSYSNFDGVVPHHLGNLSSLRTLDLSCGFSNTLDDTAFINQFQNLIVDDLRWVTGLSSLEYLDMSFADLDSTKDPFQVLNLLPSLGVVRLSGSGLSQEHLPNACLNSTLLANVWHLVLSYNSFHGGFPCFIPNATTLSFLDLSYNMLNSSGKFDLLGLKNLTHLNLAYNFLAHEVEWISEFMWELCNLKSLILIGNEYDWETSALFRNISGCWSRNLEKLSLSYNDLNGPIPATLGSLRSLRVFEIAGNHLSGGIPISLGQLSNLVSFNVSFNSFEGTLSEAHFTNLSNLESLMLPSNMLRFETPYDWVPPFQLKELAMGSSNCGQFPQWLRTQKALLYLELSNCSIKTLPKWLNSMNLIYLDLSHDNVTGPIPELASTMTIIDLSYNMITHNLPSNIGLMMPLLQELVLAKNLINGTLPDSLCELKDLETLDLSNNHLSGYLPDCWHNFQDLYVARLSFNELSGVIPNSIGGARSLGWLHLNDNKFAGQLPSTLTNCTKLNLFDIGGNNLSGKLPDWIGKGMPHLKVLILRNNEFNDTIPWAFCQLRSLQVLNLADNMLTGNIPHCFGNLSGLKTRQWGSHLHEWEEESFSQVINGVEQEYTKNSRFLVNLDLSSNYLFGEIPSDLTALYGLIGLNLSHNRLRGEIPAKIGDLESLFSLDLSSNGLFGKIPDSLSNLNFLSHLNFSDNNLSGQIPTGNQLQTLDDPSIYQGNPQLCGYPLLKKCPNDKPRIAPSAEKHEAGNEDATTDKALFYVFIVAGSATGFWGFIGVLVFKIKWRQAYFRFIEVAAEKMVGR